MEKTYEEAKPIKLGWLKFLGSFIFFALLIFWGVRLINYLQFWSDGKPESKILLGIVFCLYAVLAGKLFTSMYGKLVGRYLRANVIGYDVIVADPRENGFNKGINSCQPRGKYFFNEYSGLKSAEDGAARDDLLIAFIVPIGGWFKKPGRIGGSPEAAKLFHNYRITSSKRYLVLADNAGSKIVFDNVHTLISNLRYLLDLSTVSNRFKNSPTLSLADNWERLIIDETLNVREVPRLISVENRLREELASTKDNLKELQANIDKITRSFHVSQALLNLSNEVIYRTIIDIAKTSRFRSSREAEQIRLQLTNYLIKNLPNDDPRRSVLQDFGTLLNG